MSAYIPAKTHIDALVLLDLEGPSDRGPSYPGDGWYTSHRREDADRLGQMLVDEVVASVRWRYSGDTIDTLPGPTNRYFKEPYAYPVIGQPRRLTIIEGLKALSGYEYQACEHPEWMASEARQFCSSLRDALCSELPGYDEADTWEVG